MSEDTENFEQLRRLLALKRHEQPPPGYFNDFSRQVILRIQAGERGEGTSIFDRFTWETPWLQRIWTALETNPILAGAFGMALCALLISGVVFSDKGEVASGTFVPAIDTAYLPIAQASMSPPDRALSKTVVFDPSNPTALNSAQTDEMLLRALRNLRAEPASLSLPGAN